MTSTAWNTIETLNARIRELEAQLQRYEGAVEVDAYVNLSGELHIHASELRKLKGLHKNVKVLMMKEENK